MSVQDVRFSQCPVFCLSGLPLCGQGAWWIRQTPSGLGRHLTLMKIKSIIAQKIKGPWSAEWGFSCPLSHVPGDLAKSHHPHHRLYPRYDLTLRTQSCERTSFFSRFPIFSLWRGLWLDLRLILIFCQDDWQAETLERLPFTGKIFWFDSHVTWGSSHKHTYTYTHKLGKCNQNACSVASDSATPWTVAHQAPLSKDFPGKNTGVGCHFLLRDLPDPGIKPTPLESPVSAGGFFTMSLQHILSWYPYDPGSDHTHTHTHTINLIKIRDNKYTTLEVRWESWS